MAEAVAPGGTAQGVDPSGEAFAHAQRLTRLANCTFSNGIAEALDAPDGSYDVVATSLMIHHLPEALRAQAIGEMFRVLRPGGSVLIAELRPPASRIGRRLIGGLTGHAAMANNRVDLLEPLVREAGFEQLRSSVVLPWFLYVQALKPSRMVYDPRTRAYIERRTKHGLTKKEAFRWGSGAIGTPTRDEPRTSL
jgi:ubiquinone/menaquinone biosynthesis C-methylase UbiE